MQNQLWFFTDSDQSINVGNKPSNLASFVVRSRTESRKAFKEPFTQVDLNNMGFNNTEELLNDPDYNSKIRIYVRKKYANEADLH